MPPIMKREMTDIHMHLIPGVDDGAEDMMMALMMIMRAKEQGIEAIFATPHSSAFDYDPENARQQYQQLFLQAGRMFPGVKVYPGCEVCCDSDDMSGVLAALESGKYPTLNGTNYVLMEFSMWVQEESTVQRVEALVRAGWKPIIAHMERYKYLRENMELVDRFREAGALIQVNAYSLYDEMDDSIKNWARRLVLERKVDFLGTDAHRTYHRPPSAQWGLQWLYENVEREYADAIAWSNARKLLIITI